MDDEYPFASLQHPTAGYLFAEELEIQVMALDDFRSCLDGCVVRKPAASAACFSDMTAPTAPCASPSSPSSVVYLSPFYHPPSPLKVADYPPEILRFSGAPDDISIKPELVDLVVPRSPPIYPLQPLPVRVIHDAPTTDERERLRRRQRGYEKRYRGRKRRDLKQQRDTWLALEMKLDATRHKHCKPFVRRDRPASMSLRNQMRLLLQEERALLEDQVAMKTLQAWEEVSRIREYSDKDELRTASEWRHSAEKVIGQCAMLGPRRFHPYAPMAPQHFTW